MHGANYASGNVISMVGYRREARFRALGEVEAYWEGLRRGRAVPKRAEIDPRGIENALEYAFILERIAPGLARMRIAGMHLSDLMGMEVRGMPVSALVPPAGRDSFAKTLEEVTCRPAIARLHLRAEDGIGKPPLEGRMLLLPLENDFGDISRMLGCFETRGRIGRAPRRFDVTKTELCPIETGTAPERARDRGAARKEITRSPGFQDAQAAFEQNHPRHLRLIEPED